MTHYSVGSVPVFLYQLHDRMNDAYVAHKSGADRRHNADQCAALYFEAVESYRRELPQPEGGEQWDRRAVSA